MERHSSYTFTLFVFVEQCDEMELYCSHEKWFDMQKTISLLNYFRAHSSRTNPKETNKKPTQATNSRILSV